MILPPPRYTHTDTPFPFPPLFRSLVWQRGAGVGFGLLAVIGPFAFALGTRIVIRADSRPCRFGPAALVDRPAAIDVGGGGHVGCPVRDASSALMSAMRLALAARLPAAIAARSSR